MRVHVEVTTLSTTRREGPPTALVMKRLGDSPNGNHEVELTGPRAKVLGWLKRNGFEDGSYTVVEE